jgi:ATP-dependent RNA helicase SUPV3L1/SUV3
MIIHSADSQLKLAENGQISWQKDMTNPMPGEVIAEIVKGPALLEPDCVLIESAVLEGQDKEATQAFVREWLGRHIREALEPLFKLQDNDIASGAAKDISQKLYDSLGILPREDLESLIVQMEEEQRATLRTKKIRFGPLIVFLPELNKPAAVRLRGLLLSLWEDKDLPATVPADGIVSFSVEGKEVDPIYYRSVGYPVYGPRSIRVDMLDRVICAVYDTAKDGKFQAQHQMAEWLGSNISDLYAVLEAMGHKKIHDPADDVKEEEEAQSTAESEPSPEEGEKEKPQNETGKEDKKAEQAKPELATFQLKRGKAIGAPAGSRPKKKFEDHKKFSSDKKKFKAQKPKSKKEPRERVYIAEAESKPEDSPFAILEQLKVSQKDK